MEILIFILLSLILILELLALIEFKKNPPCNTCNFFAKKDKCCFASEMYHDFSCYERISSKGEL